jgi:hypothetical protein
MSTISDRRESSETDAAVAGYKTVLQRVLDTRPSGTRQRLAGALGKNRSFVSQIANPTYATPIPAAHLETIFEICHFSPEDRRQFLEAYGRAHPRRLPAAPHNRRLRPHTVYLPDLGEDARNRDLDRVIGDFVQRITRLIDQS